MANGGYAMVPAWLLDLKPEGNDVLAYCTLAKYGTFNTVQGVYEECRPSIETMAADTDKSPSTIRRALKNLTSMGAIEGTPRFNPDGSQAPTVYRVLFGTLVRPDQGLSPVEDPPVTGDTPPLSPVEAPPVTGDTQPRTTNPEPSTQKKTSTAADAAADAKSVKKTPKEPEPERPEIEELCQLLAHLVAEGTGGKAPTVDQHWRRSCRLLLDKDGWTVEQVRYVIGWCKRPGYFWAPKITDMAKLRYKFREFVGEIQAQKIKPVSGGAPAKSFQQKEREHGQMAASLTQQALAAWRAKHPDQEPTSLDMAYIMRAVKQAAVAVENIPDNQVSSCMPTGYSGGVIEGVSVETAPMAIGGAA